MSGSSFTLKPQAGRSRPNFFNKQSYRPPLKILVSTPETYPSKIILV